MSFFQNPALDLKFLYIITSSASALPIFAGLPLCFDYFLFYYSNDCIMQWGANRANILRKMGANHGNVFFENKDGRFWGMF